MYVFTDLDGTLLNNKGQISDITYSYLHNHPSIITVACSGRGWSQIDEKLKRICPYIICSNGALVYSKNHSNFILKETLDISIIETIEQQLTEIPHINSIVTTTSIYSNKNILDYFLCLNEKHAYEDTKKNRILFENIIDLQLQNTDIIKYHLNFFSVKDKELAKKQIMNNNYNLTSSSPLNLEITNINASKFHSTNWLINLLNINKDQILCFGDADNDMPLFKVGGINIAMKNATDTLKSNANYVTEFSNDNDGVVDFIKQFTSNHR